MNDLEGSYATLNSTDGLLNRIRSLNFGGKTNPHFKATFASGRPVTAFLDTGAEVDLVQNDYRTTLPSDC